ncbi:hypothetical protein, partial [Microbacterium sp. ZXX196]|uniref:hypothetical protein n=1 Tax=Microbacterium sp. ZXX196 TaxID=2609291 RepID=UPI001E2E05FB
EEIAYKLREILDLDDQDTDRFIQEMAHSKSRSRKMQMWLTPEQRNEILQWWHPYARKNKIASNALFFIADYKRSYPFGSLLGQVLHTIQ